MEPIESPLFNTQLEARAVMADGCPRRADVKAASNALYLAARGKAGSLDPYKASAIVAKHKMWQSARRFLGL